MSAKYEVIGDADLDFRGIVTNLVGDALKFTSTGHIRLNASSMSKLTSR